MIPFVRSPYNYDMSEAGDESGLRCEDKSLAVQDQRDEVDINTIVRRFGLTGELPDVVRLPQYGDFTGISDYREALHAVDAAEQAFMELPAELRARFHNDVQALLEFCSNDANASELERLGLTKPKVPEAPPVKVEVVTKPA
ncbi:MAG: internal scaffolding protein [Microvirus sp.]|nr:MAG: internal scaffolding protein [Microvirus sp.]